MPTGILFIFAPLLVGYLIQTSNTAFLSGVNRTTNYLIVVILALMGLSLASLDNLGQNLQLILEYVVVFSVCIGLSNLAALPIVDKLFPIRVESKKNTLSLSTMALESIKLILFVGIGLAAGRLLYIDLSWVDIASESVLFILLFLIGIQLRNSGLSLRQILLNKQGMIIAVTIITTSILGGAVAAKILDLDLYQALAMSCGFGWYSLSGILIGDAFGPVFGGASFMIELVRELVALVMIPLIIHSRPSVAIGYAGATAMDFTLPIIQSTGGVRCVPIAIVSGFILSLLVPLLMLFFVSLAEQIA
ncbi:lysine exporter LysO family protein [Vibrio tetraodonis]|uniref:lysine exporter LysO family protein n=1 Tax=Vibrio tetraodonis TaxID=2231647 RepID=UPI000E0A59C4|nr:lysine exporter LysO family protein [Vibrio tetraodonis]